VTGAEFVVVGGAVVDGDDDDVERDVEFSTGTRNGFAMMNEHG
jgi:hypothetical protein